MAKNEVVATLEHERATTQDRPPQDDIAVRAHEIFV